MNIHDEHMKRIDAVNDATTQRQHDEARIELNGFRDGLEVAGVKVDYMACDRTQIARGLGYHAMCCGVFLGWKEPVTR